MRAKSSSLIPKDLPCSSLDDVLIRTFMQYFYGANQVIERMSTGHLKLFSQKAFYDTLGGYLKYYMIPVARLSFYAGEVELRTVKNVLEIYSQSKSFLNTNGNGWREPLSDYTDLDIQVEPLKIIIPVEEEEISCTQLDLLDEHAGEGDDMIVALPRLDPEERGLVGNIWLPFRRKRTFNLQACSSAFILLRYFELTSRCYKYQGICQDTFNKRLKNWILENLEIHFKDNVLYPGLGAVLRIIESLQRKSKDLVIVGPKRKRQKTQNYKTLQNKAKQMEKDTEYWINYIFDTGNKTALEKEAEERRRWMYIYIAIALVVFFLLVVMLAALIVKRIRCKNTRNDDTQNDDTEKPKDKKRISFSKRLRRSFTKDDEEVVLYPDSSSIASTSKISSKEPRSSFKSTSKKSKDVPKSTSHKPKDTPRSPISSEAETDGADSDSPLITKKSPRSRKDRPAKKSQLRESSSSSPQAPKCFELCSKKNSSSNAASTKQSESESEEKKEKPSASTPPVKSKPSSKTIEARIGSVDEKKRFTLKKNRT